jgi:hypothetical protein
MGSGRFLRVASCLLVVDPLPDVSFMRHLRRRCDLPDQVGGICRGAVDPARVRAVDVNPRGQAAATSLPDLFGWVARYPGQYPKHDPDPYPYGYPGHPCTKGTDPTVVCAGRSATLRRCVRHDYCGYAALPTFRLEGFSHMPDCADVMFRTGQRWRHRAVDPKDQKRGRAGGVGGGWRFLPDRGS